MLLSLFCGAGGLDLGFERAGFEVGLAFDRNPDSVESYNNNRLTPTHAYVGDVRLLDLAQLDAKFGKQFKPVGVIGGPPCQSFSQANVNQTDDDPRHEMPVVYANLLAVLHARSSVDFFVLENVTGLTLARHKETLAQTKAAFDSAGFEVTQQILNARDHGTPQNRERLFLVGFNRKKFGKLKWLPPAPMFGPPSTVRNTIANLPAATHFQRGLDPEEFAHHPNHWCMQPKSPKFSRKNALTEGNIKSRSFKTLAWDKPSIAVAYGHREVHIHPSGTRRLTVYEAMMLQGFPHEYKLCGNLSSQITQISEAVPPPLAFAVAQSVREQLAATHSKRAEKKKSGNKVINLHRSKRQTSEPLRPSRHIVVG